MSLHPSHAAMAGAMLLALAAPGLIHPQSSTPDKQPTMLSHEAFARAELFVNESARPLERALFAFHFAHGSRDAVIVELAKFQNSDGGFASCLESDTRWCGSSPLGAMKALGILTDLGVPESEPHVKAVIRYLLASFDDKHGIWHALPKEANAAPHASWWEVREDTGKCEVESPLFPTAALAGYLQNYAALLPPGFVKRITESSLNYLTAAPVRMQMPDITSEPRVKAVMRYLLASFDDKHGVWHALPQRSGIRRPTLPGGRSEGIRESAK